MAGKPWEKYKGAKVLERAPEPVTEPDSQAATTEDETPPWQRFKNAQVVEPGLQDHLDSNRIAEQTEQHLARVQYTPPSSDTAAGWLGRVGRTMSFGLSDTLSAALIQRQLREQDPSITYGEVLSAVRKGYAEDTSISAEIAGSLTPGSAAVGLAKGTMKGGKVVLDAAERAGILKGALNWLGKDKAFSRIASAAGGGAAVGMTYEATKTAVDEGIGAVAGENIDPDKIWDNAVQGAVIGAVLAPPVSEALRGAAGVANWAKQAFGQNTANTMNASQRIIRTLSSPGETADQTVMRIRSDAQAFTEQNGRPPALFELISPDKSGDIADVARYYTGLSPRVRALTDEQITQSVRTLEKAVSGTKPLRDAEVIESGIEYTFSDLMRRNGDTLVDLGDEAFEALGRNRGFLTMQAKHNPEARQLLRVVEARENITELRSTVAKMANSRNLAADKEEIAGLQARIAEIIRQEAEANAQGMSELTDLRTLKQLYSALSNQFARMQQSGYAEANMNNSLATLRKAEQVLNQFEKDGFKVSLRSANAMRHASSRAAKNANDLSAQAEALGVRDAIAKVGTAEVPQYGRMVKVWNRQLTRKEAQETGSAASRGTVSPENLDVRIGKGRLPGRPRAAVLDDVRKGVAEGARIDLRNTMRGSEKGAVRRAEEIAESDLVQENIRKAVPEGGEEIVAKAAQTKKTVESAKAAKSKMSPSELQEEVTKVRDQVEGLVLGRLGGAGIAGLAARQLMKFSIPRKTAEQVVEMLGDPARMDDALSYIASRGIDLTTYVNLLVQAEKDAEKKQNEARRRQKK